MPAIVAKASSHLRLRFGDLRVLEVISMGPTFPHLRRGSFAHAIILP